MSTQTTTVVRPAGTTPEHVAAARLAVFAVFALNGANFATWASRIPAIRSALDLTPGALGLLLIFISLGSVCALPLSGAVAHRFGAAAAVRYASLIACAGTAWAALAAGLLHNVVLAAVGLVLFGLGMGVWDVSMNLEGGSVERLWGRTVMPHFHAAFSGGTVAAALVGALLSRLGVGFVPHVVGGTCLVLALNWWAASRFLPRTAEADDTAVADGAVEPGHDATAGPRPAAESSSDDRPAAASARGSGFSGWREPRTLLIGVLTLVAAFTEGTANDWMAVAMVDGHHLAEWAGVLGFAVFLVFMTAGRLVGTRLLDRFGRVPVLRALFVVALVGSLLVVLGGTALAYLGAALWGLGVALGFPVGMSAASDDAEHAASRISVVSTIAYTAFLGGPPLLGFLGDHWGILRAMLVVGVLLVPAFALVPVVREPGRAAVRRAA